MLNKTKIALAAVLIAASAGAALASNENDGGNETGGFVIPGSTDGVNPVYHPGYFPTYPRAEADRAYGYVPAKHHVAHKSVQDAR
jgi:hypothetical protein